MFKSSPLARRARAASTLALAALLTAGVWSEAQAAPDPNPPVRVGEVDRSQRGQATNRDVLRGTVTRVYSARSFDLRADDNRVYRVNTTFSVGLQSDTEIRVAGDLRGSTFEARRLTIGDFRDDRDNRPDDRYDDRYDDGYGYNNGGYYGGNNGGTNNGGAPNYQGQTVTLTGRVTRVLNRNEVEVRDDDDGTIYRVRTERTLDNSIREGDRIEARGELNGTTIRANSAVAIGNNGYGNGTNNNGNNDVNFVNFSGPLLSIDLNREEARVRAGNGYTYTIRARRSTLDNFRVGERVRVQGNWINQSVEATSLTRE